jgi:hypothetical protein
MIFQVGWKTLARCADPWPNEKFSPGASINGNQRLLYRPGQRRKPLLVVAGFEDVNLGEGHQSFLCMIGAPQA